MATWYAAAAGNINTAGRWNSLPNGTGTALTWPPASGDILVTNGFIVTINVSVNLGSGEFSNTSIGGATPGGYFNCPTGGISITGNTARSAANQFVIRVGHFSGIVYIVGDSYGSAAGSYGIYLATGATLNITGNSFGSDTVSNAYAIGNNGGTINFTGTATAGAVGRAIANLAATTTNITGNAVASTGTMPAALNASTGTLTVSGYAQASNTSEAVVNSVAGVVSVGETRSASNGRPAVLGAFRYASFDDLFFENNLN